MSDPATLHQSYTAFPRLDTPFVNADGTIAQAWQRLLIDMFRRQGGSSPAAPNAVYIQQAPVGAGAPLAAYKASDNSLIGVLFLQNTGGGPAIPVVTASSPTVITAASDGTLVASSGLIEVSRDSGVTWYQVSLVGGALSMLKTDKARISWFSATPPVVVYLPILYTGS